MKIVLDTNIFVSGIISPKSNAGELLRKWEHNSFEIITSKALLEEIEQVLNYPKIVKIISWNKQRIKEFIEYLYFFTTVVDISAIGYHFELDSNDNHIIRTYIAGKCNYLITGDKALLTLQDEFNVITLSEFIEKCCL